MRHDDDSGLAQDGRQCVLLGLQADQRPQQDLAGVYCRVPPLATTVGQGALAVNRTLTRGHRVAYFLAKAARQLGIPSFLSVNDFWPLQI